ncbi:MAG: hypothetical protein AB1Z98_16105 [Nannocystaceae bacterium]
MLSTLAVALMLVVATFASSCANEEPYVLDEEDARVYAEARCAAELECCGISATPDCVESTVSMMVNAEGLLGDELTYSKRCMEDLLDYSTRIVCDHRATGSPGCLLAVGRGAHGDECQEHNDLGFAITSCRDGLTCSVGRCVDAVFDGTQPAGIGENCSPFIRCQTGSYCAADSTCQPQVPAGESCEEGQRCENGFYCNGYLDGVGGCEQRLAVGASCDPRYEYACGFSPTDDGSSLLTFCVDGICEFPGFPLCEQP